MTACEPPWNCSFCLAKSGRGLPPGARVREQPLLRLAAVRAAALRWCDTATCDFKSQNALMRRSVRPKQQWRTDLFSSLISHAFSAAGGERWLCQVEDTINPVVQCEAVRHDKEHAWD
jgi:hypothetical protein